MQQDVGRPGRLRAVLAAAVTILAALTALTVVDAPVAQAADSGAEAAFVSSLNNIRAQHGLQPLHVYNELVGVARGWSDHMAAAGGISHNPALGSSVSANWRKLGENVGAGYSVDGLMQAFVNSPAHYENIVDPSYNYVGVGVSYGADGRMYTTHDFMYLPDGSSGSGSSADSAPTSSAHTSTHQPTPPPAPDPGPPPPPPTPPADPARVHAVLSVLRTVDS